MRAFLRFLASTAYFVLAVSAIFLTGSVLLEWHGGVVQAASPGALSKSTSPPLAHLAAIWGLTLFAGWAVWRLEFFQRTAPAEINPMQN